MKSRVVQGRGMGVVTDGYADVCALREDVGKGLSQGGPAWREAFARTTRVERGAIEAHDALSQLALGAAHQALSMGGALSDSGKVAAGEGMGLLFISSWGTIDSTVAYLETMLEAEGRYASPRYFARSVYSGAASIAAIHFGIHGPCETLCFPESAVAAAVGRAGRMLAAGRCEQVLVIWAEQASELAADLARRAARGLHRRELERYVGVPVGYGAVALLVDQGETGMVGISEESCRGVLADKGRIPLAGGPFAMDEAVRLVAGILGGSCSTED